MLEISLEGVRQSLVHSRRAGPLPSKWKRLSLAAPDRGASGHILYEIPYLLSVDVVDHRDGARFLALKSRRTSHYSSRFWVSSAIFCP
ncbi:hypothetical protein Ae201684P_011075 [Aphanomyces euteiches]|nr:hypothetical protein Ae201684P_011075 [Aphanomyces euteiches]